MNAPFHKPLTDRELRWLRHIAIHGPQSSEFLLKLCADTHSCRDTGLRTLQKLREQKYLRLPPQQRQIAKAEFNPYVYDLTPQSKRHLKGLGDPATIRPTGHWWHQFLTASVTSAIAIEAERRGYRYIPAHEVLARSGASLAIPYGRQKLIPDQLFAIDYGGKFRSFVLEVDRGTEPYRSESAKKSVKSMFQLYDEVWANDVARAHYGLKSPLLALFVFVDPGRLAKAMDVLRANAPRLTPFALFRALPAIFPRLTDLTDLLAGHWEQAASEPISIL